MICNNEFEQRDGIYHCYLCEADFDISDCDEHEEGDWENGYYTVRSCPSCGDDGGEYIMSKNEPVNRSKTEEIFLK